VRFPEDREWRTSDGQQTFNHDSGSGDADFRSGLFGSTTGPETGTVTAHGVTPGGSEEVTGTVVEAMDAAAYTYALMLEDAIVAP
jgi:hypothetical protein